MRALDDILFGFFIFFAIDRMVRLFSNGIVEPWAVKRSGDKNVVENYKLGAELVALLSCLYIVYRNRVVLSRLNKA
jgi:hypothetical protein